jgi:hypothetical protein
MARLWQLRKESFFLLQNDLELVLLPAELNTPMSQHIKELQKLQWREQVAWSSGSNKNDTD